MFQIYIKAPSPKSHHSFFNLLYAILEKLDFRFGGELFDIHQPLATKVTFSNLRTCLVAFEDTLFFCALKDTS